MSDLLSFMLQNLLLMPSWEGVAVFILRDMHCNTVLLHASLSYVGCRATDEKNKIQITSHLVSSFCLNTG